LGVEYDDAIAQAHPYAAAYLPVNRLRDGSMHDW
jgi:mannonate dehydratase